jgi:tetratricopeptide (TPR) repeat protein
MLFLKSRRADLYFWLELIVLILIVVLIMNHFKFFSQLAERFFGGEKDSAANYQVLIQKIQKTLNSPEIFAAETQFPYYIGDGYIVVGFNKGKEKSEAFLLQDSPNRPNVCAEKACLCLYKGKLSSEPVQCDILENVDYVFTLYYGKVDKSFYKDCCFCKGSCKSDCAMAPIPKQDSCSSWTIGQEQVCDTSSCTSSSSSKFIVPEAFYKNVVGQELKIQNENYAAINKNAVKFAYFFLYGKNDMYGWLSNIDFGVQNLYIEKYTESDTTKPDYKKTYLFVAYPDQSVLAHSEAMRLKYGKKTAKEYSDKIDSMLKQNDMKSVFDEALRYRTNYPLAQLSEDTYKRLSDYAIEQINSMKKDPAKSQELKDFLPNAAAIHNDYLRFYETDPKQKYVPLFLFRLGLIYAETQDYSQAISSFEKILASFNQDVLAKNASIKVEEMKILREGPTGSLENTIQNNKDIISAKEKETVSAMSDDDKVAVAKAYYNLGIINWVRRIRGETVSDDDIGKNFEVIIEKYSFTDYGAAAAYRLAQLYEWDKDTACYYYGYINDFYSEPKNIFGDDISREVNEKFDKLQCQGVKYDASLYDDKIDAYLQSIGSPLVGIGPCVVQSELATKVPAMVTISIALHESAAGTSGLAQKSKNLFGMKCTNSYVENTCKFQDKTECCKVWDKTALDLKYEPNAQNAYRVYQDFCDSVNDFTALISTASRYSEAMQYTANPDIMVRKVQEAGYATDPNWAIAVAKVMHLSEDKIVQIT